MFEELSSVSHKLLLVAGRTKLPSFRVCYVYYSYSCKGIQIGASRNFAFLWRVTISSIHFFLCQICMVYKKTWDSNYLFFQWKTELYEPAVVHGANSGGVLASCNPVDGGECGRNHNRTCSKRYQTYLVPLLQFFIGVFRQLDQFLGHQAYKCFDPSGNNFLVPLLLHKTRKTYTQIELSKWWYSIIMWCCVP